MTSSGAEEESRRKELGDDVDVVVDWVNFGVRNEYCISFLLNVNNVKLSDDKKRNHKRLVFIYHPILCNECNNYIQYTI